MLCLQLHHMESSGHARGMVASDPDGVAVYHGHAEMAVDVLLQQVNNVESKCTIVRVDVSCLT